MNSRRATAVCHQHSAPEPAARGPAWTEAGAALDREVQRLPAAHRDAFVLCTLAGAGHADAARQLGIQERTVRARLARARTQLGEALARGGVALPAVLAVLDLVGAARPRVPRRLAQATARAVEQVGANLAG
jgi:DNA-directed RNA polymerase specialized sigma24 family protein